MDIESEIKFLLETELATKLKIQEMKEGICKITINGSPMNWRSIDQFIYVQDEMYFKGYILVLNLSEITIGRYRGRGKPSDINSWSIISYCSDKSCMNFLVCLCAKSGDITGSKQIGEYIVTHWADIGIGKVI